ncbi:hypothetical protein BC831DRAFT_509994 [Entophlyctis helioformis]|nr:hypothetical protein BC831DRAFT_509994 [Entophlyctis helioformis]
MPDQSHGSNSSGRDMMHEMGERLEDCTSCRVTGTLAGLGIAGYALYERNKVLLPTRPDIMGLAGVDKDNVMRAFEEARRVAMRHRGVLAALAAVSGMAGIYRGFMYDPNKPLFAYK